MKTSSGEDKTKADEEKKVKKVQFAVAEPEAPQAE